jgi:hypothetical protein
MGMWDTGYKIPDARCRVLGAGCHRLVSDQQHLLFRRGLRVSETPVICKGCQRCGINKKAKVL